MSAPEMPAQVSGLRLGPVESIPVGEGRAFAAGDEQVAVFRLRGDDVGGGPLRAMQAACPHAGGPLADGQLDGRKVVCPLHNHVFSLVDGSCSSGDFAVRMYPVRAEDGQIVLGDRPAG